MATETRSPHSIATTKSLEGPGPYVAVVREHLDVDYMGSLKVELLKTTSEGNSESSGEFVPVSYLSPFYGVTPYAGTSENDGYDYTQKSYGFWAVPPDIGTKVLVIFAEGNRGKGYWIGCIQDQNMNFMVPGNASTKFNKEDPTKARPVGEYNKKTEDANGTNATQYLKPCNPDACLILDSSGLADDPIRGTTTSSARRDLPSMVFGWSSPGPVDRRNGKPTVKSGGKIDSIDIKASRLTGTTLVMDDGDPTLFRKGPVRGPNATPSEYVSLKDGGNPSIPFNELFRIRTRTGHQILLHNAEDLIYIAHGSGDSWIEMTANGKIDIYSKDSISIHTENDFNFKADRNINLEAGQNINIKAGNQMAMETKANWTVKVGADGMLTCAGSSNIKSAAHKETADRIDMNGPPAAEAGAAPTPTRIPKRGSWTGQENKNPLEHTPEKTDNDPKKIKEGKANTTSDDKNKEKNPEDTFKQCQVEPESIVDDDPVADSTEVGTDTTENKDATLVNQNGVPQTETTKTVSEDGTKTTTTTSTTTETITSGGKAVLVGNDGNVIPEASAPKITGYSRNDEGKVTARFEEVTGVDADGFAYTEKKRIAVDPETGQDLIGGPKYKGDTFDTTPAPVTPQEQSALDAETAAFEAEFDRGSGIQT
jgi:hypothetical protein